MANVWHSIFRPERLSLNVAEVSGVVLWRDEFCHGPVPDGLVFADLGNLRAEYWRAIRERRTPRPTPEQVALLQSQSRPRPWSLPEDCLPALCSADEVVLWFPDSAELQLSMLQCVDLLPEHVQVSLMPMPEGGFDQQIADATWAQRVVLDSAERSLLKRLWQLFRSPSPVGFHDLALGMPRRLGMLAALAEHFRGWFPNARNGLDQLEWELLETIRTRDGSVAECVGEVLCGSSRGDLYIFDLILRELQAKTPLVVMHGRTLDLQNIQAMVATRIGLTEEGEAVLRGELDAVRLNGIDRWVGGCHLSSAAGTGFRWDGAIGAFCPI